MKKLSFLLLAAMLASACQKENTPPKSTGTSLQLDGTYTGYFSLTTIATPLSAKLPVQLVTHLTQEKA